jgi:hypothetical protein
MLESDITGEVVRLWAFGRVDEQQTEAVAQRSEARRGVTRLTRGPKIVLGPEPRAVAERRVVVGCAGARAFAMKFHHEVPFSRKFVARLERVFLCPRT